MIENNWILCPICRNKTRIKIRGDTVLENFPLYCPKCKQETHINAKGLQITGLAAQNGGFEILYFKPPFSF